jgi:diguanylate cyclase (GGDEF)-like protein
MQECSHPMAALRVPEILKWLLSRPSAHSWIIILLVADLAAIGDLVTGPGVWFGPVYLAVICLAAWCRGWRAGLMTGIGCMTLTLLINGATLYPFFQSDWATNLVARFAAISVIIAVVSGSRSVYIREWWMARTDPLTGALNRQALFELGEELASENSWRLLIFADLDGLKLLNDARGHAAGDRAILALATAVRPAIRRTDLFARVGGDEFVVFMCVRDRTSAEAVAARLHERMNSLPVEDGAVLRCSVGALIVPPGKMDVDTLVRLADTQMYAAKTRGACLQMLVADNEARAAKSGRARKNARMPDAAPALTREPVRDRRGKAPVGAALVRGSPQPRG